MIPPIDAPMTWARSEDRYFNGLFSFWSEYGNGAGWGMGLRWLRVVESDWMLPGGWVRCGCGLYVVSVLIGALFGGLIGFALGSPVKATVVVPGGECHQA